MSATAASCCSGSRDTPSERPPPHPPYGHPSVWTTGRTPPTGRGGRRWASAPGAPQTTLDSCPPALRPVLPPRRLQAPFHLFLYVFFFLLETDSIHIEYNIFVYLTGRGGGGDRGGAGPAARYSSPRGHWGRDPRPLSSPLCTVLWIRNTHLVSKEFILRCVCVCVCLLFRLFIESI